MKDSAAATESQLLVQSKFPAAPADHRFFTTMSIVCSVLILAGFASRYVPHLASEELPTIIHVHAAVFTGWLVLFIVQTNLARVRRISLHRTLGTASVGLALLMVGVGVEASLAVTRAGHLGIPGVMFPDPAGFLLLNLVAVAIFAVLFAAGWALRRNPQAHKRAMLMATVGLAPPGIARLPGVYGHIPLVIVIQLLLILAGPAYDWATRRRVHPVYVWGALVILLPGPPAVAKLAATDAWHRIASMLL
jgi:hypothetical protein